MRIPQLLAGVLLSRQAMVLPSTYCAPECPSCKDEVSQFDVSTSCVANSSFIEDCGHCQTCIMTYAIENGGIESQTQVEQTLYQIINLCENSTISNEISALQSQASLMSALGKELATTTNSYLQSMTSAMTITPSPTGSPTGTVSSSTASSHPATTAASVGIASAESTPLATGTASPAPPLNDTWVSGPVLGSVLGLSTIVIVIYFTRRKLKNRRELGNRSPPKELFFDDASNHSQPRPPSTGCSKTPPATELEVIEQIHELAAVEPVGSELSTPMDAHMREEDWPASPLPLPLSPLPLLFAMTEMRDERAGNVSPKHNTFYHP